MKNFHQIKLIIFDCDGVLSDGKVVYTEDNSETKSFSAFDGLGITLLHFTDIKTAVITGRESKMLVRRCKELKIDFLYQGVKNKVEVAEKIIKESGINWRNVAFMGDDWNDYPLMKLVYISATTNNAFPEIKKEVHFVSQRDGGNGAAREFIEYILKGQSKFSLVIEKYLNKLKTIQHESFISET